ncbi:hypothetical protein EJ110_NYTH07910 [Nymphaea thermarum]|nr:hypothetical protein EJ110_NYTH07910 [Nymphaea thermarum]
MSERRQLGCLLRKQCSVGKWDGERVEQLRSDSTESQECGVLRSFPVGCQRGSSGSRKLKP